MPEPDSPHECHRILVAIDSFGDYKEILGNGCESWANLDIPGIDGLVGTFPVSRDGVQ